MTTPIRKVQFTLLLSSLLMMAIVLLLASGVFSNAQPVDASLGDDGDQQTQAALASAVPVAAPVPPPPPKPIDPSDAFFKDGVIPQIKIELSKEQADKLRGNQRAYVECTLIIDGKTTIKKARVKLKGAAGSFRNLDDRPAFTLSMPSKKHAFHGLDKFHLNNSVQDESFVSELISSQICRAAGYPATRATHARVFLNDRDLGFYGLKEGFDEHFLARNFKDGNGNFYDGGFCQDIDANLEKDEGTGPEDRSDLKALIAACREGDVNKRWVEIEKNLDVDMFLKFVALELMMSHWDGYAQNRNNYRVYFRGDDKKAVFMPHGMDQMFGDANFSVFHVPGPIVTSAVLNNPAWRERYRQIVREMLPLFEAKKLHEQIDEAYKRMRPVAAGISEDRAKHLDGRVQDFKNRVAGRYDGILRQFPPEPIPFNKDGFAVIEKWEAKGAGDAKLESKQVDGKNVLLIETGPSNNCDASFRSTVRLARGQYKVEAKVKTNAIAAINDGRGGGAGLRISGGNRVNQAQNQAAGTADWQTVSYPLEIAEDLREVVIVAELRSTAGSAMFDMSSLRVVKVK